MSVQFKTDRIRDEFTQLLGKNPRLFEALTTIALHANDKYNKDTTVTCIYRSPDENGELYRAVPIDERPKAAPHTTWDAADLRSYTFEPNEIIELVDFINERYKNKDGKKSFCHAIPGNVMHFHVYIPKDG